MKSSSIVRSGDCVCGVAVSLHFDSRNAKLTCAEACDRQFLVEPADRSPERGLVSSHLIDRRAQPIHLVHRSTTPATVAS